MRTAYLKQFFDDRRARFRRRGSGFMLALAAELLIIIALLTLWPPPIPHFGVLGGDKTFQLYNAKQNHPAAHAASGKRRPEKVKPKDQPPPPRQPPVAPPVLTNIPGLLVLSHEDYAATDIGKMKSKAADTPDGADAAQLADDGGAGDSEAVGKAPNGEPLYAAEWYREPTDAQLGFYLPHNVPPGAVGFIACRTAPRYKVEDCVALGDNAPGSGLARGIVNAAWQFQVRPPRKGGKDLIGAWVRIRINIVAAHRP